jgi:hypothetical protein
MPAPSRAVPAVHLELQKLVAKSLGPRLGARTRTSPCSGLGSGLNHQTCGPHLVGGEHDSSKLGATMSVGQIANNRRDDRIQLPLTRF